MEHVPESLQRLVAEIDGWLDLRCPDRALERLGPLLEEPKARIVALTLRVRAYVGSKRHKEAVADIEELRLAAHDPEWLDLTEAWCRKRMQDLPAAIGCMERVIARNGKSAIGHFNLGCYLALAGDSERALDEVSIACGIDASFRDMLHDEPDLDALRGDSRFQALGAKSPGIDPAEAAAEADAFEDDLAEGFEEDLEFEDEDLDDGEDDEEDEDEEDDDPRP